MPKEYTGIVRPILQYLNALPHCRAINIHGNEYMEVGTPDIICCLNGRMILFECKRKDGKPTAIQLYRIKQWKEAGAIAVVVYSLEDVKEVIKTCGALLDGQ